MLIEFASDEDAEEIFRRSPSVLLHNANALLSKTLQFTAEVSKSDANIWVALCIVQIPQQGIAEITGFICPSTETRKKARMTHGWTSCIQR
jgi:hypothetical protein